MDTPAEDFKDQFHFGLVEVVFEWARGMPFAEITNLTDVQEGLYMCSGWRKINWFSLFGKICKSLIVGYFGNILLCVITFRWEKKTSKT